MEPGRPVVYDVPNQNKIGGKHVDARTRLPTNVKQCLKNRRLLNWQNLGSQKHRSKKKTRGGVNC